jgi:hypothetical protein
LHLRQALVTTSPTRHGRPNHRPRKFRNVNTINLAAKVVEAAMTHNARAIFIECWASMREWLKAGAIPGDLELVAELTGQ